MRYRMMAKLLVILAVLALGPGIAPARAQTAPDTYFVPGQVIISGLPAEIDAVVRASGLPLSPIRDAQSGQRAEIDLSYTDALPMMPGFPFATRRGLVIRLYSGPVDVVPAVNSLNRIAQSINGGVNVRAELNNVVGRDPALVKGSPWSVGGSPWSVGGSSAAGSTSAAESFLDQWAFGPDGVGLFEGTGEKRRRTVAADGSDVQVAIFDTSPFTLPVGITTDVEMIDWITPPLKLDVRHPTLWGQAKLPVPNPAVDESDHGLFIAGIIHVIAPASEIRLVRVLNDYGQGDMFSLCHALHAFISGQAALGRRGVINLSLGVFPPPPSAATQGLPKELSALETAIMSAEGAGIMVAAAAGNQAASASPLPDQQLPAGYDTVIGVAGSTSGRERSCFSNPGDLAAPGGDGVLPGCTPDLSGCKGSCDLAIISLAATKASPGDGYVYWLGSSFAAPFASGAAALLLDQYDGKMAPDEMRAWIAKGATRPHLQASDTSLGAGIISLPQILSP